MYFTQQELPPYVFHVMLNYMLCVYDSYIHRFLMAITKSRDSTRLLDCVSLTHTNIDNQGYYYLALVDIYTRLYSEYL